MRSRGTGSHNGAKPGLLVEFDRYRPGRRFLDLRSVVLDNHWQDASMMREQISMRFYRRLGWPASREAPARVFVNGEYAGLYASVEDVNKPYSNEDVGNAVLYLLRFARERPPFVLRQVSEARAPRD